MKRKFADLHLRVNSKDPAQIRKLAQKAMALGYRLVGTPLPPETRPEEIQKLKAACAEIGVDFVSRIDLRPRNQNELLHQLRKMRRYFEVLCVLCESKEVARQAAKDHRVDLLNFPLLDYRRRFFDHSEAELASGAAVALEIDVKPLLVLEGPPRVRLLASLRREVSIARGFRLPVVVSSGASELLHLRKPREMAVLASLFGLEGGSALDAVSSVPDGLVERNRLKLSTGFVAPGIHVVKQETDP